MPFTKVPGFAYDAESVKQRFVEMSFCIIFIFIDEKKGKKRSLIISYTYITQTKILMTIFLFSRQRHFLPVYLCCLTPFLCSPNGLSDRDICFIHCLLVAIP